MDCAATAIIKKCKCSTYYFPSFRNTKQCNVRQYSCVKSVYNTLQDVIVLNKDNCNCLPSCTQISYDLESHYSPIRNSSKDRLVMKLST